MVPSDPELGRSPVEVIIERVRSWPGVSLGPHPYDGIEFLLGEYEFGHVHRGWESVHINYPRRMRDALIEAGETDPHPSFSESGWTSFDVADHDHDHDRESNPVDEALRLLRLSYLYRSLVRWHTPAGETALESLSVAEELAALDPNSTVRAMIEDLRMTRE